MPLQWKYVYYCLCTREAFLVHRAHWHLILDYFAGSFGLKVGQMNVKRWVVAIVALSVLGKIAAKVQLACL